MNPRGPVYPGVRQPSVDMQAVRDGRRSTPLYVDVPLSTSRARANGSTGDVTDVSGKALVLNIAGNSFYSDPTYDSGGNAIAGNAIVHFQEVNLGVQGTPFMVTPQFVARVPFTQLLIENYAQAGKNLRIIYGVDIDFQVGLTANVAPVQVIDGGKARTLANQAFMGKASIAAVAANNSHVQLLNPSGSTKRQVISQVVMGGVSVASQINLFRYDTALTTLIGNAPSKNIGGAGSVGELRAQVNGVGLGTGIALYVEFAQPTTTPPVVVFKEPVVLIPGRGLLVQCLTQNSDLLASFEFFEEDNV